MLGLGDDPLLDILLGSDVQFFLDQVAEIVRGKMEMGGTPGNGRLPHLGRGSTGEIIVKQEVELCLEVRVVDAVLLKLPFEKALAIRQEGPNAKAKHVIGQVIALGKELCLDVGKTVEDDATLGRREGEGFVDIMVEEVEHVEVTPKSCTL